MNQNSKILALDIGDRWTGIAISDITHTFARPYRTVHAPDIYSALTEILSAEPVTIIIVGHPRTMHGTRSAQTISVEKIYAELQDKFPHISFHLWDERLSSKRAEQMTRARTRDEKLRQHAIAAAHILDLYLTFLKAQKPPENISH